VLPTDFQNFIHTSRYARWLDTENRRETWAETVARYFDFFENHLRKTCDYDLSKPLRKELETAVLNLDIMPSMRCLMTAGPALERCHVAGYNCAYLHVDGPRVFDETMYILMCGTGVGFSVERQFIAKMPEVSPHFEKTDTTIVVQDSKSGWARSLKELVSLLYAGQIPLYDTSKLRPAGARLKTFGGRASGPEPLEDLFNFCINIFVNAAGRRLTSIECHDIMCKIGEVVVVGGVRRSALISLSNLTDARMREAKSGEWWIQNGQRRLANNSVCYTEKPDMFSFMEEWKSLYMSKSGERGIFNRKASQYQASLNGRRDSSYDFGTNPCSEIILRSKEFCNLSEIIVKEDDTLSDLKNKARLAAILGTFQSTLTDFKYLGKAWQRNCEEERLLGVSMTGILDNVLTSRTMGGNLMECLEAVKAQVVFTNKATAAILGVPQSVATTCVKPSGTVSQLVNSASGIHPRYSDYYIRTVRGDVKDPLTIFLKDQGVPNEPDVMAKETTTVFSFPVKSPRKSVKRSQLTAINQLELWKQYQDYWCEHKPSITVYVREEEWMAVGAWVYEHFNTVSGISFLPYDDHIYRQAPYQEITGKEFRKLSKEFPVIEWEKLREFEKEDTTTGAQEYACSGGLCDIVDIGR